MLIAELTKVVWDFARQRNAVENITPGDFIGA